MRALSKAEKKKRGCVYCLDYKRGKCKHDECPYHELDEFDRYSDYLKATTGIFDKLLKQREKGKRKKGV